MKYDPEDLTHKQILLLDNVYASLVANVALQLKQEEGETKKSLEPFIDEAHKLIMATKKRVHEITLPKHQYL